MDEGRNAQVTDADALLWQRFASARSSQEFVTSWLALQCRLIGGVSDAVLVLGKDRVPSNGGFSSYEPKAFWPEGSRDRRHLADVVERALSQRRCVVVKTAGERGAATGTVRFHAAHPIAFDGVLQGAVAIDAARDSETELHAAVRQLQWGTAWLELLHRRHATSGIEVDRGRLPLVLNLVATLLRHDRSHAAATGFATELATHFDCDRASVGFRRRRGGVRLAALSHSAQFGKKTNLIRAIEAAMAESLDQQNAIVHPEWPDARFQIKHAHEQLAREFGSGSSCSVPLVSRDEVIGVLTLERGEERPFSAQDVELCEAVGAVAGPILELERRESRNFIVRWRDAALGLGGRLFGPRHLVLKLCATVFAALVVFFAFAKGDYRVSAEAVLEGSIRRVVVAPFEGYVAEAPARPGDELARGALLCVFEDRELQLQKDELVAERQQALKQREQAIARRNAAEIKIIDARLEQIEARIALVDEQLARTRVTSPLDGIVVRGDLSQAIGSPVKRGQELYELAPLDSYRLILQVDESEIDEVRPGQKGELVLAASPTETHAFTVTRVTPVSSAEEGVNFFRVEAELESTPERLRPGMEGIGKITCGRRHLIWNWTHRALDWIRLFFWEWMP